MAFLVAQEILPRLIAAGNRLRKKLCNLLVALHIMQNLFQLCVQVLLVIYCFHDSDSGTSIVVQKLVAFFGCSINFVQYQFSTQ